MNNTSLCKIEILQFVKRFWRKRRKAWCERLWKINGCLCLGGRGLPAEDKTSSALCRPACPPKIKLDQLSAGGPAHLPMKFGMHSGRQGFGKVHRSVALKLLSFPQSYPPPIIYYKQLLYFSAGTLRKKVYDHKKTTAKYKHVLLYHLHLLWVDLTFWNHWSIQLYLRMLWSPWAPENLQLRLCYNAKSSAYAGLHGEYWKNHK